MKKPHIFLIFLSCILISSAACRKEEPTVLKATPESLDFEEDGGIQYIDVETNIDNWTVSSTPKWVVVEKSDGKKIKLTTEVNVEITERQTDFTITAKEKTVKINISQKPKTTLKTETEQLDFKTEGGAKEIKIISNSKEWSIIQKNDWIEAQKSDDKVLVKVDKNKGKEIRKGSIIIGANKETATIEIWQDMEAFVEIEPKVLNFSYRGGTQEISIKRNKKINVAHLAGTDWLSIDDKEEGKIRITAEWNPLKQKRQGKYEIRVEDKIAEVIINQSENTIEEEQRPLLEAFYKSTNGDQWKDNTNWLSSKPIGEWKGVDVTDGYGVSALRLSNNNLGGQIPKEIGSIEFLSHFWASNNQLTGLIPTEMGDLSELTTLHLNENNLSGSIPDKIGELSHLNSLLLYKNRLTGSIPKKLLRFATGICPQQDGYGFDNSECK